MRSAWRMLIALGMRFDDRVTGNLKTYAQTARKIHVDIDRAELNKNVRVDVAIAKDVKTALDEWLPHVAQYNVRNKLTDFVGLGRMVLSYPEMPSDVLAGKQMDRKRICRTFSDCTTGPRTGLISGCYPLDAFYKERPEALTLKEFKKKG